MINEQSMTHNPRMEGVPTPTTTDDPIPQDPETEEYLRISRDTYQKSTRYYETYHRAKWEHGISLFRGKHPPGSKYYGDQYKHRSRLFRPKTRANVRKHEAAAAAAYFSSNDVLSVEPTNDDNPESRLTASLAQWLVNMRLRRTIPWFMTLMGAYQNTMTQGAVASKVYWDYKEVRTPTTETITDEITGATTQIDTHTTNVTEDTPRIDLIPLENLRFDPDADWRDPINTSPYVIQLIPMYAGDVIDHPTWRPVSLDEVLTHGMESSYEHSTRRSRRDEAPGTSTIEGSEFSLVWVREYLVKHRGEHLVWHTLGDELLLSDPTPMEEIYTHGNPFRVGYSWIEAFNPLPDSMVYVGRDLQAKTNDVDNQRFDNVKLVLNKRYFIRRSAQINTAQLYRSVPGGSVTMNDPMQDIRTDDTRDVTGSAYAEQGRVDVDFDELTGSFSQSTMASNPGLAETVGVPKMMNASADAVTEYQLKVFAETWVEPVLNQLAGCLLKNETDDEVLREAGVNQRWADIPVHVLENEVRVTVNVGMGATDPMQRIGKFMTALNSVANLPNVAQRIKEEEVIKEVFGRLGYKDGMRFFNNEEEARQQQEAMQHPQVIAEQMKAEENEKDRQYRAWELQQRLDSNQKQTMLEISAKYEISMEQLTKRLADAKQARVDNAKVELTKKALDDRSRSKEMALKARMGSGI